MLDTIMYYQVLSIGFKYLEVSESVQHFPQFKVYWFILPLCSSSDCVTNKNKSFKCNIKKHITELKCYYFSALTKEYNRF